MPNTEFDKIFDEIHEGIMSDAKIKATFEQRAHLSTAEMAELLPTVLSDATLQQLKQEVQKAAQSNEAKADLVGRFGNVAQKLFDAVGAAI